MICAAKQHPRSSWKSDTSRNLYCSDYNSYHPYSLRLRTLQWQSMSWFNADKWLTGRKIVKHFTCIDENKVQIWVCSAFFKIRNFIGAVGIESLMLIRSTVLPQLSRQIPQSVDWGNRSEGLYCIFGEGPCI